MTLNLDCLSSRTNPDVASVAESTADARITLESNYFISVLACTLTRGDSECGLVPSYHALLLCFVEHPIYVSDLHTSDNNSLGKSVMDWLGIDFVFIFVEGFRFRNA